MPCYHPITAWYSATKNSSGKRSLVFSPDGGFGLPIQIACGQCIGCRLKRAAAWAARLTHEVQFHDQSCFLTLTYDPDHIPGDGSISVRPLQLFFKRVRNAVMRDGLGGPTPDNAPRRVLYFAVGEYGEQYSRPHYHVILFGLDFRDDRRPWGKSKDGRYTRWTSETLTRLWGLGRAEIGSVTPHSAGYCARYTVKKLRGGVADVRYQGKQAEFMVCSAGLGTRWFRRFGETDLKFDYCVISGRRSPVPKFYDNLQTDETRERLKADRKARALKYRGDQSPRRLRDREEVTLARIKSLTRDGANNDDC